MRYNKGRLILDSSRANYSFEGLHQVLQTAFARGKVKRQNPKTGLILGFGAGSAAEILLKELKLDIKLTGVEKDEVVMDLAKKYFGLDQYEGLKLVHDDAFEFVRRSDNLFDLILVDIFIDLQVPDKFYEEDFIRSLSDRINSGGACYFNVVICNPEMRDKANSLFERMNAIIGKTEWHRIRSGNVENWVFVAKKN